MDKLELPLWAETNPYSATAVSVTLSALGVLSLFALFLPVGKRFTGFSWFILIANLAWPFLYLNGKGGETTFGIPLEWINLLPAAAIAGRNLQLSLAHLQPEEEYGTQNSLKKTCRNLGLQLALLIVPLRLLIDNWDWSQPIIYVAITFVIWEFIRRTGARRYGGMKYGARIGIAEGALLAAWTIAYLFELLSFDAIDMVILIATSLMSSVFYAAIIYAGIVWILGKKE